MKKIVILFSIIVIGFISCSKEEEEEKLTHSQILGRWNIIAKSDDDITYTDISFAGFDAIFYSNQSYKLKFLKDGVTPTTFSGVYTLQGMLIKADFVKGQTVFEFLEINKSGARVRFYYEKSPEDAVYFKIERAYKH